LVDNTPKVVSLFSVIFHMVFVFPGFLHKFGLV